MIEEGTEQVVDLLLRVFRSPCAVGVEQESRSLYTKAGLYHFAFRRRLKMRRALFAGRYGGVVARPKA